MSKVSGRNNTSESRADIGPMAVSGVHESVIRALELACPTRSPSPTVLDIGAGHGALTQKLLQAGYRVAACDLYPELFALGGVECRKVDANGCLPYEDASFDVVVAIELMEHIERHESFFLEVARVLRPGGKLLISTPNVLSFKSRLIFFWTGYFYSFGPLQPGLADPVTQHIAPFTIDRYRWRLSLAGMDIVRITTDKRQNTSLLFAPLSPLVRLAVRMRFGRNGGDPWQNSPVALFGRTILVESVKR